MLTVLHHDDTLSDTESECNGSIADSGSLPDLSVSDPTVNPVAGPSHAFQRAAIPAPKKVFCSTLIFLAAESDLTLFIASVFHR